MHLGLIIPSSNTVMEEELNNYVTVHSTRISLQNVDEDSLKKMNDELSQALELITDCHPDVIVYGCTSGSFVEDVEEILHKWLVPGVTTSHAVVSALHTLDAHTISVATPYINALNKREKAFLESHGFIVRDIKGLGILNNTEIGKQLPQTAYDLAKSLKKSDVTFISCTNFKTFDIISDLEKEINTPVVSSNSASLWKAFELAPTNTATSKTTSRKPFYLGKLLEEYL